MKLSDRAVTTSGRRFIILWTGLLIAIFIALSFFSVNTLSGLRQAAIARHNARIDASAVEPGRTAADALPAGANPRKVKVGIYLDGIFSISVLDSKWSPVFYIWFRWTGDDINPGETFNIVEGEILSKQKLQDKVIKGEHYAVYLVRAQIAKFFDSTRFPIDDHLLTVAIEESNLQWQNLEYVPDTENTQISSRVKMPGYQVYKTGIVMKPHTYKSNFGDPRLPSNTRKTYSQLIYGVWNSRPGLGTYLKIFLGLFAAVMISMLALFITPTEVDPRFGLGVGGFFGAVANTLLSASLVTDSGTLTLLDMVNGIGMITIFLTLVQSTISLHIYANLDRVGLSRLFDRVSFVTIATGFLIVNLLIPGAAMVN
ncbi:hypothetical protein [Pseudanabaena sp. PCC 6802]|uniref:hypothetical protein n=1 Tax=Pseudanabaena sp. PCC 6802 TaxID=118173 RepID=UPI000348DFDD|nr:hypothetical protein [Pseudanabaena sp. PCC 6802]